MLEGLNLPRYPSVPAKLRAQRKPVDSTLPRRRARLEKVRLVVPEGQAKEAVVLGARGRGGACGRRGLQRIGVA